MSKQVEYDGEIHEFPDDFSDADIATALKSAPPPVAGRKTTAPDRLNGGAKKAYLDSAEAADRYQKTDGYLGGDFQRQMTRNLGVYDDMMGAGAALSQGGENIIRRFQGKPIESTMRDAYHGAAEYERDQQREYAKDRPVADFGATITGALASGRPTAAINAVIPAVKTAGYNMAAYLPFAIGQEEGDLAERLPGAAKTTATVGGLSLGLGALANKLTKTPTRASVRASEFEKAGVRPTMAAINGGMDAGVTKAIGENWLAGGRVRGYLQDSLDDIQEAAGRIGSQYGSAASPEKAGEIVRAGVKRFAQSDKPVSDSARAIPTQKWSFGAKANALYEDASGAIIAAEKTNPWKASAKNTAATLQDIGSAVDNSAIAKIINDPKLGQIAEALGSGQVAKFGDLRALRTWVREAQSDPTLRKGVSEAALARLEGALTQDILTSAQAIGGPQAAQRLARADDFYRAGMNRINKALAPFGDGRGSSAYMKIMQMAGQGGGQNSQALLSLKRTLQPQEWRTVAATLVDNMGKVKPSSADALEATAFSIDNFVTNYAKLSPEGRKILFGSMGGGGGNAAPVFGRMTDMQKRISKATGGKNADGLADALDNLAKVAGYQKGVEAWANKSRSGVSAQNVGTIGSLGVAAANPQTIPAFASALGAMMVTGEAMTNPAFVRWLASAPEAGQTVGGARQSLAALSRLASADPALGPVYKSLSDAWLPSAENPAPQQQRTGTR